MRCKIKVLSVNGIPASDGSIVPRDVMQQYIDSAECKKDLEDHVMLSSLTHACRAVQSIYPDNPGLSKVIAKDDSLLLTGDSKINVTPTHYVDKLYIENDGWLYAEVQFLKEDGLDDASMQNIRRITGLLKNGVMCHSSAVIVGYWKSSPGTKTDILSKCVKIKGVDFTLGSSWKDSQIVEIQDDNGEKLFSDTTEYTIIDKTYNTESGVMKAKTFSDLSEYKNMPKSSKINNAFTQLKVKQFSMGATIDILDSSEPLIVETENLDQKEFTQAAVRDRLREAKMSPRMYFRRVYLSYSQVVKSMGGVSRMKEEDLKVLKSMFTSDLLWILNQIQPEVLKGKQINTLLGCSSISKSARQAAQTLQQPLRMAGIEVKKQGFLSKMRYQKLQNSYLDFVKSMIEGVFGPNPEPIQEEPEDNENEK